MAKKKVDDCFTTFAWLIYREVENYVNEHEDEYEEWERARTAVESDEIQEQENSQKKA